MSLEAKYPGSDALAVARVLDTTVGRPGWGNIAKQGVCPVKLLIWKVQAHLVQEMAWPEVIVA